MTTFAELLGRIEESAGFKVDTVPMPSAFVWLPAKNSLEVNILLTMGGEEDPEKERARRQALVNDLAPMVFRAGPRHVCPLNRDMTIVALFHDDEEVRVYAVDIRTPQELMDPGAKGNAPTCYRLAKEAPVYVVERMTEEVFIEQVAEEWREIQTMAAGAIAAADQPSEDYVAALEQVVDRVRELDLPDDDLKKFLAEVDEYEEEEEDEEEEDEPTGVAAPPAPVTPIKPPPTEKPAPSPPAPPPPPVAAAPSTSVRAPDRPVV